MKKQYIQRMISFIVANVKHFSFYINPSSGHLYIFHQENKLFLDVVATQVDYENE